ncbi:MAG: hypothetical protein SOI15_05380 [Bifidobacterium crudilactis]|jgi:ppGpp synthetase/RelA/SpoT-type nucleotidyltranferase
MSDLDWFSGLPQRPWTKSSIRSLKHAILEGSSAVDSLSYQDVSVWYSMALALVVSRIKDACPSIISTSIDTSFRVKTIDTLRGKLKRQSTYSINRIHDVMGVRLVGKMSLSEQDMLANSLAKLFDNAEISDMRETGHSGYRAVHLAIILPNSVCAEVQIRTTLQDEWANCYELAADIFGRRIRYGEYPDNEEQKQIVEILQNLSLEEIKACENDTNEIAKVKKKTKGLLEKVRKMGIRDPEVIKSSNDLSEALLHASQVTDQREQVLKVMIKGTRQYLEQYSV